MKDSKLPEILDCIKELLSSSLVEKGFSPAIAEKIASDSISNFSNTFGGQAVQFAKNLGVNPFQPAPPFHPAWGKIFEILNDLLKAHTKAADEAESTAFKLTSEIALLVGGESLYFPKNVLLRVAKRNKEIFQALDRGESHRDVAKKYDLSERRIYQINASR